MKTLFEAVFKRWRWLWWLVPSVAQAQIYSADMMTAEWKATSSPFLCTLSHKISGFGKAVLLRKAGAREAFYLESDGAAHFPLGETVIETFPPVWRSEQAPVRLGKQIAVEGARPISLTTEDFAPVLAKLSAGTRVMFSSHTEHSSSPSRSVMRVVVEAKNFSPGYKAYKQCVADMIPYTFGQVARTLINYAEDAGGLTAANKIELLKVVRYTKADSKVVGVFVDGHSDDSGAAEIKEATSKNAAEWVTSYFVEQGVPAEKITTRWHGDKFPIANNKKPEGRAQNRRVTVRLEDEAARKEMEQKAVEEKAAAEKAEAKKLLEQAAASSASTAANAKAASSKSGKMTPEDINRMVEGLDLISDK